MNIATLSPREIEIVSIKNQFDNVPIGCMVATLEGAICYINHEAARLLGYDGPSDLENASVRDIEAILNCGFFEARNAIMAGEAHRKTEHKCTNCRGQFKVLNIFCNPFRDADGKIIGILSLLQDVSESTLKKQDLEEAIYELSIMSQVSEALSSSAELDEIFKVVLTGVTSSQGLGFNRAFLFLIDNDNENLVGQLAVGPTSPEEAGRIWTQLESKRLTLREMLDAGHYDSGNGDSALTSLIKGWKIPLSDQNIFGTAVLTGQAMLTLRSEALGAQSRSILARLGVENIALAPIISKGRRLGLIVADNQITGREISPSLVELLQAFACQTAVAIERSRLYDSQVERAEELARINRQLAESQEQIIRVEKMSVIGELTSSIAHELRNPLTVIGGFANLLLTTGTSDANNEYLNIILSETKRAESVLHQVLDFSKASRAENRAIGFHQLVHNCCNIVAARLKRGQPQPALAGNNPGLTVWGNPDQLQHAIVQFLNMIIDGSTENNAINLDVSASDSTVFLTISVTFEKNDRKRLTRMLEQGFNNPSGTQRLSILVAGETIRYHGGNFGLESSEDGLPKIRVELPLYKGSEK
jgi:PAS domain S-box-containing protein